MKEILDLKMFLSETVHFYFRYNDPEYAAVKELLAAKLREKFERS